MIELFNNIIYIPLYNTLIGIISFVPGANVFLSIIILTFIVKLFLLPLSIKMTKTQIAMKNIAPELEKIKKQIKDPQKQALEILSLYKKHNIKPFSSILLLLIQLPIIIALYLVFVKGGLPNIDTNILYKITPKPDTLPDMSVFNIFYLDKNHNIVFAVLAGLTQFALSKIMAKNQNISKKEKQKSEQKNYNEINLQEELTKSIQMQMIYVLPIIIGVVSYIMSSIVATYFIANNIFSIFQELIIHKLHGKTYSNGEREKKGNNKNS